MTDVIYGIKDRLDNMTVKHHLHIDIPKNMPPVEIDDVRIGEVLTNLVENAVKFSDDNTNITISAELKGKEVVISVADEGIGIPPELHQKIFERFFQGERPQGRTEKGGRSGAGHLPGHCRGPRGKNLGGKPARQRRKIQLQSAVELKGVQLWTKNTYSSWTTTRQY